MPQIKVTMRSQVKGKWTDPDGPKFTVVMVIDLLPKGGGNRSFARRLGRAFKHHEVMGPHVGKVVIGTSRVTVHIKPSMGALAAVAECQRLVRERALSDDPDQLPLPFTQ